MHATICKRFTLEAAHELPNHDGKCQRLHGHSYVVEVIAEGPVNGATGEPDEGMLLDFARIKAAWQPLHDRLDHQYLNDLFDMPTTAENLAGAFLGELRLEVPEIVAVRVYETASSWAEVGT